MKSLKTREELKDWHYCRECGIEMFGKRGLKKSGAITLMQGDCSRCGDKNVTLIPVDDFLGIGD